MSLKVVLRFVILTIIGELFVILCFKTRKLRWFADSLDFQIQVLYSSYTI